MANVQREILVFPDPAGQRVERYRAPILGADLLSFVTPLATPIAEPTMKMCWLKQLSNSEARHFIGIPSRKLEMVTPDGESTICLPTDSIMENRMYYVYPTGYDPVEHKWSFPKVPLQMWSSSGITPEKIMYMLSMHNNILESKGKLSRITTVDPSHNITLECVGDYNIQWGQRQLFLAELYRTTQIAAEPSAPATIENP